MNVSAGTTLALLVLLVASASGSKRIAGGRQAVNGQFPYQVYLDFGGSVCGGGLITPRHVLTAAHCFTSGAATTVKVVYGLAVVTSYTSANYVFGSHFTIHQSYGNFVDGNDIAIVQLFKDVPLSDNVKLMSVGTGDVVTGKNFTLAGWGETPSSAGSPVDQLMYTSLQIVNASSCQDEGKFDPNIQICMTAGSPDACQGDSGGSIVVNINGGAVAAGLVSYGPTPCGNTTGTYGVYTRNGAYVDWINNQLSNLYNATNPSTSSGDPVMTQVTAVSTTTSKAGAPTVLTVNLAAQSTPAVTSSATPTPTTSPTTASPTTQVPVVTTSTPISQAPIPTSSARSIQYSCVLIVLCLFIFVM
ncbi:hypothetical protein AKO1_007763 [Acrasis kona]|uniref:Peptidase S1 domain-containing protein n=1 Tax=Acrasis kona TaxID=1008807 RepID=A0AAW2YSC7_9EUKA